MQKSSIEVLADHFQFSLEEMERLLKMNKFINQDKTLTDSGKKLLESIDKKGSKK